MTRSTLRRHVSRNLITGPVAECPGAGAHGHTSSKMTSIAADFLFARWARYHCNSLILKHFRPLGSVVEHSLHTRGVSSSNLLAGTNNLKKPTGDVINFDVARFCPHTLLPRHSFAPTLKLRTTAWTLKVKSDHEFSQVSS